eukprot:GHVS01080296.1.p1 GENE.GHVS01080296.1~~GHVS01080296.1.p1  ORF type:complete len:520 (-),score=110.45 GHVS01080296.1:91-1650(-)
MPSPSAQTTDGHSKTQTTQPAEVDSRELLECMKGGWIQFEAFDSKQQQQLTPNSQRGESKQQQELTPNSQGGESKQQQQLTPTLQSGESDVTATAVEGDSESPPPESSDGRGGSRGAFFSGSVAGGLTALVLQPLDVMKTKLQQHQSEPSLGSSRFSFVCRSIYLSDGFAGFWRGTVPTLLRIIPGAGLYFLSLHQLQSLYPYVSPIISPTTTTTTTTTNSTAFTDNTPAWFNITTGGAARGIVDVLVSPFSVLKTRLEATSTSCAVLGGPVEPLKNLTPGKLAASSGGGKVKMSQTRQSVWSGRIAHSARQTLQVEGWRGFYSGLGATLLRDVPYTSIYFGCYKSLQALYDPTVSTSTFFSTPSDSSAIGRNFICSSAAGFLSSIITHPADVVRTRLQLADVVRHRPQVTLGADYFDQAVKVRGNERYDPRYVRLRKEDLGGANKILGRRFVHSEAGGTGPPPPLESRLGVSGMVMKMVREEGMRSLWSGLLPRLIKRTLMTAFTWTAFEELYRSVAR